MAISPNAPTPGVEAAASEPRSGSLADVLDVILDKGIVIDAFVRVSLVGIEILTLDARVVVASVDTYMHFAREAHRLQMGGGQGSAKQGLAGMMGKLQEGGAHSITRGALRGAGEGLREGLLPSRGEGRNEGGVVHRAVSAIKEKAGGAVREALSPGDQDEGSGNASAEGSQTSASASAGQEPSRPPPKPRQRPQAGRGRRAQPAGDAARGPGGAQTQSGGPERSGGGSGGSAPEGQARRRAAPSSRRAPRRGPGE